MVTHQKDAPMDVSTVAEYLLWKGRDLAADEGMSNLKLQKLVYYCQGFHLAIFDRPLFREQIDAWTHGPVVEALYQRYKGHGASPIPSDKDFDPDSISSEVRDLIDEVYATYGQFSGWRLREMTHQEPPWQDAYETKNNGGTAAISHSSMKRFFKSRLAT